MDLGIAGRKALVCAASKGLGRGCAEALAAEGVEAGLVALPWLRDVDGAWLAEIANGATVVTLDNHYVTGGQGDAVLAALAAEEAPNRVHKVGVTDVPKSGGNDEVLKAHGLDAEGIAAQVRRRLGARVP